MNVAHGIGEINTAGYQGLNKKWHIIGIGMRIEAELAISYLALFKRFSPLII